MKSESEIAIEEIEKGYHATAMAHNVFGRAKERGSLPDINSADAQERQDAQWISDMRALKEEEEEEESVYFLARGGNSHASITAVIIYGESIGLLAKIEEVETPTKETYPISRILSVGDDAILLETISGINFGVRVESASRWINFEIWQEGSEILANVTVPSQLLVGPHDEYSDGDEVN